MIDPERFTPRLDIDGCALIGPDPAYRAPEPSI